MNNVSALFKTNAQDPQRKTLFKVKIANVDYTTSSIIECEIEDSIISEEDFELGSVISSTLSLSLKTSAVIPTNAEIIPYTAFELAGLQSEWLPLGKFYIDNRKLKNGVYKIEAFDKLILSQQKYYTDLLFPNTMLQVMIEAAYNLGITISASTLTLLGATTYLIQSKPTVDYAFRDMIRFIASSYGTCARMNKSGELEFFDISNDVPIKTITRSRQLKGVEETNPIKVITRLAINYETDLEPFSIGDGELENTLWLNNPFITEDMANAIFLKVQNLSYMPCSLSWILEPQYEPGDLIAVQTKDSTINTLILRQIIKFKGGISAVIEAPSSTVQESEFGPNGTIGQQIAEVGKRIGLFANTTNTSKKTIKQVAVQVALMPLTTASETDIEFVVTFNGVATVDSILRVSFRIAGEDVGRVMRVPVKAGLVGNFISFSTLRAKIPKISDWLFLRMVIDTGNFVIEKEECEFYIYGGNIVSGDVKPILEFEDTLDEMVIDLNISETILIELINVVSIVSNDNVISVNVDVTDELINVEVE